MNIRQELDMNTYWGLSEYSDAKGHRNQCAPIALSLVSGIPFDEAHDLLVANGSRKSKTGFTRNTGVKEVLNTLGFKVQKVDIPKGIKTNITLEGRLPVEGKFLVTYRGHIAAVVGGKIEDWLVGRRIRVLEIYEVTKEDSHDTVL